jgi:hypothetical protein
MRKGIYTKITGVRERSGALIWYLYRILRRFGARGFVRLKGFVFAGRAFHRMTLTGNSAETGDFSAFYFPFNGGEASPPTATVYYLLS